MPFKEAVLLFFWFFFLESIGGKNKKILFYILGFRVLTISIKGSKKEKPGGLLLENARILIQVLSEKKIKQRVLTVLM